MIVPVILCGGAGTRLWPSSRALLPKQFLPLTGARSLLCETYLRVAGLDMPVSRPIVLCNANHRFMVERQLREVGADPLLILEPVARNTAPALAAAALVAARCHGEQALLLVLPSDHVMTDVASFHSSVGIAAPMATAGRMLTFGIVPDRPETGYGYIAAGEGKDARPVERFVEKPDLQTARAYVESGRYLWNSGMFLFPVGACLGELERYAPEILAACRRAVGDFACGESLLELDAEAFHSCPSNSIDYAVMEKTSLGSVVPLNAGWSDVGSWTALHAVSAVDDAGNFAGGDVVALDCRDSYMRSESRLVGVVGLDGCIVVETKDAVMVAPRGRAQDVKALVDELTHRKRKEVRQGREVFRPWGSYDSLESGEGYQVKRLVVLPGAMLSLQLHHRRAEHWVVVAGVARITRDDEVFELRRNEHAFIPLGARHRIENPGEELLQIIEVQIGDYLGEDDIVRLEDKYGRQGRTD